MGLIDEWNEPIFLRKSSDSEKLLEKLIELEPLLNTEGKKKIRHDIRKLEYGIIGEKTIAFELQNSYMPMYILHDIYLSDDEQNAQIDYMVFTKKICFIIECKNLYGNIEIRNNGDFIRTMRYNGRVKKEGIYSPITQNQRHLDLIKRIRIGDKNIIAKHFINKYFEDGNKTIVVLANSKTVLNAKYAKKDIKNQVIRADQLIKHIKSKYNDSKDLPFTKKETFEWAQFYLNHHKEKRKDYTEKYKEYFITNNTNYLKKKGGIFINSTPRDNVEEKSIYKELKYYRLIKSREENIKAYCIYNDNQMKDLISKMPRTIEQLHHVYGFGEVKVNKYGEDIVSIINKY